MMQTALSRLRGGAPAVALAASLLFGTLAGVALAHQHWHETSGLWHGFVHGSNISDSHFIARVGISSYNWRGCQIDSLSNVNGFRTEYVAPDRIDECSVDSHEIWSSATECKYRADNYSEFYFNWHRNYPVNYCG